MCGSGPDGSIHSMSEIIPNQLPTLVLRMTHGMAAVASEQLKMAGLPDCNLEDIDQIAQLADRLVERARERSADEPV